MNNICPICKEREIKKHPGAKYCGRECYYEMKRIRGDRVVWTEAMRKKMSKRYRGSGNPMHGKVGHWKGKKRPDMWASNHARWKNGYINENGYRYVSIAGIEQGEHRHIMERHLGRKLSVNEVVHHKNGNKIDNRLDNLEVVTRDVHINMHREDLMEGKRVA